MTTLGWSALSSLILEVSSQSDTLFEALSFTNVAMAVCAVVTALILLADPRHREEAQGAVNARCRNDDAAENLRALAGQLRCAESRARLLSLAERIL
jgi:hypothetical protein